MCLCSMRLAIVGSTKLAGNKEALRIIEEVLDHYQPTVVVSGGAEGIDLMAEEAATRRGIETKIHLPKVAGWENGYKPRNLLIAKDCDVLVRIVASDAQTYGSGWTRDRAVDLGKPTKEFVV